MPNKPMIGTKFHGSICGAFEIGFGIAGGAAPLLAGYIFDTRGSYELAIIIMATGLFIAMGLSCAISSPQEQAGFSWREARLALFCVLKS